MFICLPLAFSFSHNCVWTRGSFSTGLAATRGTREREREMGRASSGEAWQTLLVIFPPLPIDSVSGGSVFTGPMSLEGADKHALFSYQGQLITGTLRKLKQEEVAGFSHQPLLFDSWLCSSFPNFFPSQAPNPVRVNPIHGLNPPYLFSTVRLCSLLVKLEQGVITESWVKHVLSNSFWSWILYFPNGLLKSSWDIYSCFQRDSNRNKQEWEIQCSSRNSAAPS